MEFNIAMIVWLFGTFIGSAIIAAGVVKFCTRNDDKEDDFEEEAN